MDSQTVLTENEKAPVKSIPKSKKSTETLPVMNSNRPKEEWNFSNVNPKSPHERHQEKVGSKPNSEKQHL